MSLLILLLTGTHLPRRAGIQVLPDRAELPAHRVLPGLQLREPRGEEPTQEEEERQEEPTKEEEPRQEEPTKEAARIAHVVGALRVGIAIEPWPSSRSQATARSACT